MGLAGLIIASAASFRPNAVRGFWLLDEQEFERPALSCSPPLISEIVTI